MTARYVCYSSGLQLGGIRLVEANDVMQAARIFAAKIYGAPVQQAIKLSIDEVACTCSQSESDYGMVVKVRYLPTDIETVSQEVNAPDESL